MDFQDTASGVPVARDQKIANDDIQGEFDRMHVSDTSGVISCLVDRSIISSFGAFAKGVVLCNRHPMDFDRSFTTNSGQSVSDTGGAASAFTSYGHGYEVTHVDGLDSLQRAAMALQLSGAQNQALSFVTGVSMMCRELRGGEESVGRVAAELVKLTERTGFWQFQSKAWALLPISEHCRILNHDDTVAEEAMIHPAYVQAGLLSEQVTVLEYQALVLEFERLCVPRSLLTSRKLVVYKPFAVVPSRDPMRAWIETRVDVVLRQPVLIAYMVKPLVALQPVDAEVRRKAVLAGGATVRCMFTVLMTRCVLFTASDVHSFVAGTLTIANIAAHMRRSELYRLGGDGWAALDSRRLSDVFYMIVAMVYEETDDFEFVCTLIAELFQQSLFYTSVNRCVECGSTPLEGHVQVPYCTLQRFSQLS